MGSSDRSWGRRRMTLVAAVAGAAIVLGGCGAGSLVSAGSPRSGGSAPSTSARTTAVSAPGTTSPQTTVSTPASPQTADTTVTTVPRPSGPVGCLRPRQGASLPAGGWLPESSGAVDYEPEDAGAQQSPSATAEALAARFVRDLGADGTTLTVRQFATSGCVVDWDVVLAYPDGSVAFLRVLQLSAPIELGSFPLAGDGLTQSRDGDVSVYWSALRDRSWEGELAVRDDGLLVEIHVRSGSGPDTTGYPTTMTLPPPPGGSRPAPVSAATVRFTAMDILQWVAAAS